ncbi:hypothetical protein S40293_03020 [Stachybotrys chartarum IBT 40293]|nr:hypothetical protein S40293_03020 [Stachybotrys chartarum IBT 40293]
MAVTRRSGRKSAAVQTARQRHPLRESRTFMLRPKRHVPETPPSQSDDEEEEISDESQLDYSAAEDFEEAQVSSASSSRRRRSTRGHPIPAIPGHGRALRTSRRISENSTRRDDDTVAQPSKRGSGESRTKGVKRRRGRPPKAPKTHSSSAQKRQISSAQEGPESNAVAGNIPDWLDPRVPYAVWADIFFYAGTLQNDISWLIRAATACSAFLEPALSAIYLRPPIKTRAKFSRLAALLEQDPTTTRINYRAKVESLHINIHIPQLFQLTLYKMIAGLPRLRELVVFTPLDHVPYRDLDKHVGWRYPDSLFRALAGMPEELALGPDEPMDDFCPTYLKSWEWSGRFFRARHGPSPGFITGIHQSPAFSGLTKVSFTNFQLPSLHLARSRREDEETRRRVESEDQAHVEDIAQAISQLKSLNHLVFESSTVMNDQLLPLLPKNLKHLELINCWEIKSEDLSAFLATHGTDLRTLTLLHNQSLNLEFLTTLADTCPCLEELRMSMLYYRHHDSVNDADPMYDFALLPGQLPKWPQSIRVIDIEHIRDWSVEAAETFLQSLIDSAPTLPNLRHLSIKTMLDIPWQSRATVRREWRSRLEHVFLRPLELPKSSAISESGGTEEPARKRRRRARPSNSPSRRSGRIAASHSESDPRLRQSSKFRRKNAGAMYREPDTDEDLEEWDSSGSSEDPGGASGSESPEENEQASKQLDLPLQGLCSTVNILFDNQKPREVQYSMEDFLNVPDDQSNGDSDADYNGIDSDEDSTIAF